MKNWAILYLIFFVISWPDKLNAQIIDSSFYSWTVYEIQETELDYKKCYILAHPIKKISDHPLRLEPYVMIARYQEDRNEEITVNSGYEYKLNSDVFLLIDKESFNLSSHKNMSWAKTRTEDAIIIQKMINSAILKVRSNSALGTFGVDEYSLKGLARAYARMRNICP